MNIFKSLFRKPKQRWPDLSGGTVERTIQLVRNKAAAYRMYIGSTRTIGNGDINVDEITQKTEEKIKRILEGKKVIFHAECIRCTVQEIHGVGGCNFCSILDRNKGIDIFEYHKEKR